MVGPGGLEDRRNKAPRMKPIGGSVGHFIAYLHRDKSKMTGCRIGKVRMKNGPEVTVIQRARDSDVVERILEGAHEARTIGATSMAIALSGPGGWVSNAFVNKDQYFSLLGAVEELKLRIQSEDDGHTE